MTAKGSENKFKCILCDEKSGSHEHIFPAQLGGRRTSKKVYCQSHNEKLGKYVVVLNNQLSLFNSLLGVRPDRKKTTVESLQLGRDGVKYRFTEGNINIIPADVTDIPDFAHGKEINVSFSSQEDCDAWIIRQQAQGNDIHIVDLQEPINVLHDAIPLRLSFGGPEFMKAISYIGLSFYAQYCPELIHSTDISALSSELFDVEEKPAHCQWDAREFKQVVTENAFEFGHTFLICVSADDHTVHVWISLFSTFNFLVSLGKLKYPIVDDHIIRIDINPLAEKAPADLIKTHLNGDISHIVHSVENLSVMISNQSAAQRVAAFQRRIEHYILRPKIRSLIENYTSDSAVINQFIEQEAQGVYNLLTHADKIFFSEFEPELLSILPVKRKSEKSYLVRDYTREMGLSEESFNLFVQSKNVLALALTEYLSSKNTNVNRIISLLSEDDGLKLLILQVIMPYWQKKNFNWQ
ncbi:hypothetical protein [Pantoea endophytica]|uniref:hypothetical protein n=1 Tax=Pantoea endophytica TaxID=92488 RepID=UPI001AE78394|nr:hypothetical protein [Pantoea endophytica]